MQRLLVGVSALLLSGCGARSVRTFATPVASAPPTGKVRIVPLPPVITKTKAVYEWQVVCDQHFATLKGKGWAAEFSRITPINRLKGDLPTVTTLFIEVKTQPHGDGTMSVDVSQGERAVETRPLLEPSAKPESGNGASSGFGLDGFTEAPASSFVSPLVRSSILAGVPSKTLMARITYPASTLGEVTAIKDKGDQSILGYRGIFPLDKSGQVPNRYLMSRKLIALMDQGYQVSSRVGGLQCATTEDVTLAFAP